MNNIKHFVRTDKCLFIIFLVGSPAAQIPHRYVSISQKDLCLILNLSRLYLTLPN